MSGYNYPPQGQSPPPQYGAPPPQYGSPPPAYPPHQGYGAPAQQPAPYAAPMAPPPKGPSKMKKLLPVIFIVIGVVLAGVTLGVGWYSINESASSGGYYEDASYNLFGCVSYTANLPSGESAPAGQCLNSTDAPHTAALLEEVLIVVILGLALGAVAFILGLLGAFGSRPKQGLMAMLPWLLALVAAVMLIVAPMLFYTGLPGAAAADYCHDYPAGASCTAPSSGPLFTFSGSNSTSYGTETWGPGIGWDLCFGAFALFFVGFLFLFLSWKKNKAAMAAAPPMYGQPMPGQPGAQDMAYQAPPSTAPPAAAPAPSYPQYAAPPPAYQQPAAPPAYQPAPAYQQPPPPPTYQQPPAYQQPGAPQGMRCPACGYTNPPGYNVCGNCRSRLY